jgi:hypothetical protein
LMEEYRKMHSGNVNGKPRTALTAAATEDRMANIECFYCGQKGHMKKDRPCRKFRQGLLEEEDEEESRPVKAKIAF